MDKVFFPGRLPNVDMYTILKHSQMSFVSLVNDKLKDSVPTKMFEALGVGCPVLLAAAGDSANILNECGLGMRSDRMIKTVCGKHFQRCIGICRKY